MNALHYRSQFLVGLPFGSVMVGFLTLNPELMTRGYIPRQHCIVTAGPLAVLIAIN